MVREDKESIPIPSTLCTVGPNKNVGIMFLNEVVVGKPHQIYRDNCSLTKAPTGFDSVIAMGTQEPGRIPKQFLPQKNIFF